MMHTTIKIKVLPNAKNLELPQYATVGSAGLDLRAAIENCITILPLQRLLVPTGIVIELPQNLEAQVRPRSGLALKNGISVLNTPGTIDSDYRGEIGVILINLSTEPFIINRGDRIAQMVISRFERVKLEVVENLTESERKSGSFGSTGI